MARSGGGTDDGIVGYETEDEEDLLHLLIAIIPLHFADGVIANSCELLLIIFFSFLLNRRLPDHEDDDMSYILWFFFYYSISAMCYQVYSLVACCAFVGSLVRLVFSLSLLFFLLARRDNASMLGARFSRLWWELFSI